MNIAEAEMTALLSKFVYLQSIHLHRELSANRAGRWQIELALKTSPDEEAKTIHLSFVDAVSPRVGEFDNLLVVRLNITQIKSDGWEGINYRVTDGENGIVTWNCRDVVLAA